MTPKLINAKSIIANVSLQFNLTGTNWIPKAYEWIGLALQGIGGRPHLERVKWETKAKNHRVPFPCNLTHILSIEYKGKPLELSLQNRHMSFNFDFSEMNSNNKIFEGEYPNLQESQDDEYTIVAGNYDVKNINRSVGGNWYYLNNNTIITSFASDDLIVYYEGVALDEEGYPLVPDSFDHNQAISFFILYMYLSNGNTHPAWKIADVYQMWETYRQRAYGRAVTPTLAEQQAFTNAWARIVNDHFADSKFRTDLGNMQSVFNI